MADLPQTSSGEYPAPALIDRISANVAGIRNRIEHSCERSGRKTEDITLVGVTKTVGLAEIRALYQAGIRDFGENRIEVGLPKVETLSDLADVNWHMIGHLQRNKAAKAVNGFHVFHGVESSKLVEKLTELAVQSKSRYDVFLEVNIAGEDNKYGVQPEAAVVLARQILQAGNLRLRGLMTMAPFTDDTDLIRSVFRGLRQLRDTLQQNAGEHLPDLSMGMSGDFEIAVEEGSTLVRVGTALFA